MSEKNKKLNPLSSINISDMKEIKTELFNRKRELMNMRIHGTLKKDPSALLVKNRLIKECTKITIMLAIAKNHEEQINKKTINQPKEENKKINKKVKKI